MANVRDEELKRLEKYAYGLGVKKINYAKPLGDSTGAEWSVSDDGTEVEITFYMHTRISKRALILNFIHELAHHLSWIYRGKQDSPELETALQTEYSRKKSDPLLDKEDRKLIYLMEKEDAQFREAIWKEVDIKIPIEYLQADIEVDIWGYKRYYMTGHHPTNFEMKKQQTKMRKKYGVK